MATTAFPKANETIASTALLHAKPTDVDSVHLAFAVASFGYNILKSVGKIDDATLKNTLERIYDKLNGRSTIEAVGTASDTTKVYQAIIDFITAYALPPIFFPANDLLENLVDTVSKNFDIAPFFNHNGGNLINQFYKPSIARIPDLVFNVLGYLPPDLPDNSELKLVATGIFPDDPGLAEKCMSYMLQCNYLSNPTEDFKVDEPKSNAFFMEFGDKVKSGGDMVKGNLKAYLEGDYSKLPLEGIKSVDALIPAAAPSVEETETPAPGELAPGGASEGRPAKGATPETLPYISPESANIMENMAYDDGQLKEAYDVLSSGTYFGTPLITTYHPGVTEKAIAQLLDNYTDRGEHRPFRVTVGDPKQKKTVMIPPAFKEDKVPAIWSRAVIGSMGFPFVNFTCPPIMEIIKGTDPKAVKSAYKSVKPLFRQCGLKKPIATLKEFAHAQYRNCALNAVSVDAEELFLAEPGSTVSAGIIDPYSKTLKVKGNVNLPVNFLTAFFGVLSPVNAVSQYCELSGMDSRSYLDYLAEKGKPPMYILNPKKCSFRRGPKGSLFHELFSSKTAPVLVRARVSSHDGGFIMPEKLADMLFAV